MDEKAVQELQEIKTELKKIITEMNSIALGVKKDFTGIGSEKCAKTLSLVSAQYEVARQILKNIDTK